MLFLISNGCSKAEDWEKIVFKKKKTIIRCLFILGSNHKPVSIFLL
ncbi:MAG: hypothetical protein ACI976_003173 [Aureispira sp.]|jgi:hypothetical protein